MGAFGERIKARREELRLTQSEIAKKVGLTNTYISAMENGSKPPPPYAIVRGLAAALEMDEEELWELAEKERKKRALERVRGKPASFKKQVTPPQTPPEQAAYSNEVLAILEELAARDDSTDHLAVLREILDDPEFARAFCELKKAVSDKKQRRLVLEAIRAVACAIQP